MPAFPKRRGPQASHQMALPTFSFSKRLAFGGSQKVKGNPKTARPVVTNQALHLVLRSSQARGEKSFLARARRVEEIVRRQADRFGIRLYDMANAGNHLHLVVRVGSRRALRGFLRAVTGILVRLVMGTERGSPLRAGAAFWDARPFSRIVAWGKDYKGLRDYLMLNRVESLGLERFSARAMLAKIARLERQGRWVPIGFS